MDLLDLLKERLSKEDLQFLEEQLRIDAPRPDYGPMLERVARRAARLESEVKRRRERVESKFGDLDEQPEGRRRTILRNSPPAMLMQLALSLGKRSFQARFDSPQRSIQMAELALECAQLVSETEYLSAPVAADLKGEALAYLANARRINSDLPGAESALEEAAQWLQRGTGDRLLRANLLSLLAPLRFSQGRCRQAAALYDQEIRLRLLLHDRKRLSFALIDRGIVAAWSESLAKTCDYLSRGVSFVSDPNRMLLALQALGDRLARDGRGLEAWKVVCSMEVVRLLVPAEKLQLHFRWLKGLAYRALGEYERARRELSFARVRFTARGESYTTALLDLDLAAVNAALGATQEVKILAREAHAVLSAERLDDQALAAFLIFHKAAMAEQLSAETAVRVANFIVRYQQNRNLRFEEPADS